MKAKVPQWVKKGLRLIEGGGEEDNSVCIMQAVALISPNETRFTDHPRCVNLGLTHHMITLNDYIYDEEARDELIKFAPRLLETKGKTKQLKKKAYEYLTTYVEKHNIKNDPDAWGRGVSIAKRDNRGLEAILQNIDRAIEWHTDTGEYGVEYAREWAKALDYILPENAGIKADWKALKPYVEKV